MICVSEQERLTVGCVFFEEVGTEVSVTTVSLGASLLFLQLWNELLVPIFLASVGPWMK